MGSCRSDLPRWTLIFSVDEAFIKSTQELVRTRVWKAFFLQEHLAYVTQGEVHKANNGAHTHTKNAHRNGDWPWFYHMGQNEILQQ